MRVDRRWSAGSIGAFVGLAALAAAAGCASLIGIDEPDVTAGDAGTDAAIDASFDAASPPEAAPDAPSADAALEAAADAADAHVDCQILTADNFVCGSIAHFIGTQTVDGFPDEFCGIYATVTTVAQGADPTPAVAPPEVDTVVSLRAGWDTVGLHLHAHVAQSVVIPPSPSASTIYVGDGIELFASASGTLTGPYGPGHDPGLQVYVSAPPALSNESTTVSGPSGPLDPSLFASRLVPGGYEIEVELPWSTIAGSQTVVPPVGGDSIGFDMTVDLNGAHGDGGGDVRDFQSSLVWNPPDVDGGIGCIGPYCSDLGWCTPVLEP